MPNHLFVAHVPFTLILVGAGLDVLGALRADEEQRRWGGFFLILGAAAALLAFFTGQGALPYAFARPQPDYARIEAHTQWAGAAVWLLAIAGGLRLAWRHHLRGLYGWVNLALGILSALLIVGVSYSGLMIAHG